MRITIVPEDETLTAVQFSLASERWQARPVSAVVEAFRKKKGIAPGVPIALSRAGTRRPMGSCA